MQKYVIPSLLKRSFIILLVVLTTNIHAEEYIGKYCEVDGAETESGDSVSGQFYMYSDKYGEADGVYTEDGEAVYGECYRYSGRYCELEGAYTDGGEAVTGECYIY